ncbi:MAG: hypothetical protein DWH81_11300 [Planctomycetota bacterium]|nr:MAG: hypothetical protein DWH81_11300 [Planctomycetota bacterium]
MTEAISSIRFGPPFRTLIMFFRFCAALSLVVLIAAAGIAVEKQLLDMKRTQTLQVYRLEQLEEKYARLKLRTQELGAPSRLMESLEQAEAERAARRRATVVPLNNRR